jgi:hypothetical protein
MGDRSDEDSRPQSHGADLAALLGATITVLLTITDSPGAWGLFETIIGVLLLIVLLAFFWRRRPSGKQSGSWTEWFRAWKSFRRGHVEPFLVGFALAIVMGFVVAIISAWPIQSSLFHDEGPSECRSFAVAQATTTARDLSDIDATKRSGFDSTKTPLQYLIEHTLLHGDQTVTGESVVPDTALQYAFYHQYDATVGDCLADETFEILWWVWVASFLLTLIWWYWNYIKKPTRPMSARK